MLTVPFCFVKYLRIQPLELKGALFIVHIASIYVDNYNVAKSTECSFVQVNTHSIASLISISFTPWQRNPWRTPPAYHRHSTRFLLAFLRSPPVPICIAAMIWMTQYIIHFNHHINKDEKNDYRWVERCRHAIATGLTVGIADSWISVCFLRVKFGFPLYCSLLTDTSIKWEFAIFSIHGYIVTMRCDYYMKGGGRKRYETLVWACAYTLIIQELTLCSMPIFTLILGSAALQSSHLLWTGGRAVWRETLIWTIRCSGRVVKWLLQVACGTKAQQGSLPISVVRSNGREHDNP